MHCSSSNPLHKCSWLRGLGLLTLVLIGATASAAEVVGFRGGGNGVWPGSTTVPTTFSEDQGVKWKVTLPSIGHASPIVIKDRVLVMCDGGHELQTPTLLCYDADTGKELWRAPIDIIDTLPAGIQQEARQRRAKEWQRLAAWGKQCARVSQLPDAAKKYREKAEEQSVQAGYPVWFNIPDTQGWQGHSATRAGKKLMPPEHRKDLDWLKAQQVMFKDLWFYWYTMAFPTPVSDGEHVWVATGLDAMACIRLADGQRRWIINVWDEPKKWQKEREAAINSPVLVDGKIVWTSEYSGEHIAIDADSGKLLWRTHHLADKGSPKSKQGLPQRTDYSGIATLLPIELDGSWFVVSAAGLVLRVSDGEIMLRLPDPFGEPGRKSKAKALSGIATGAVIGDRVYLAVSAGGGGARTDTGIRCYRLQRQGDTVTGEAIFGDNRGQVCGSIVAIDGKIYGKAFPGGKKGRGTPDLAEFDAVTGKPTASAKRDRSGSIGLTAIAGHLITTANNKPHKKRKAQAHGATFTIYRIPGLKVIGSGSLGLATDGSEDQRWTSLWGGSRRWGWAHPAIYNNRLYVRSNEALYCVGK